MRYPEELHVDSGTEFKGEVLKLMKEHDVTVKGAVTKYHHKFTAFVENLSGYLSFKTRKSCAARKTRRSGPRISIKSYQC